VNDSERMLERFDEALRAPEDRLAQAWLAASRIVEQISALKDIAPALAAHPRVIGAVAMDTAIRQWPYDRLVVDVLCPIRLESLPAADRTLGGVSHLMLSLTTRLDLGDVPVVVRHRMPMALDRSPLIVNLIPGVCDMPGAEPMAIPSLRGDRWIACDPDDLVRRVRATNRESAGVRGAPGGGLATLIRIMKRWAAQQSLDASGVSSTFLTMLLEHHASAWHARRALKLPHWSTSTTIGVYLYEVLWQTSQSCIPEAAMTIASSEYHPDDMQHVEPLRRFADALIACVGHVQQSLWASTRSEAIAALRTAFGTDVPDALERVHPAP
jgi:hypothetical protein